MIVGVFILALKTAGPNMKRYLLNFSWSRDPEGAFRSSFRRCPGFGCDRVKFLKVAGIVLFVGFLMKIMLITQQCSSCS